MEHPKLRDSKKLHSAELYPLNVFPKEIIENIGKHFVYLLCTGRKDIEGSDWGDAFAEAIEGTHLDSPVGIADVVKGDQAWSLKTVKHNNPLRCRSIRLISGRCSPDYSYGITDPHKDIENTGRAVLGIWNERVNIAHDNYKSVRNCILIRSKDLSTYCIFEEENLRFPTNEYTWTVNKKGNFLGKDKSNDRTKFTWQPHGSQFTIHTDVPRSALKFEIQLPPIIPKDIILNSIGFDPSWVKIINLGATN